MFIGYAWKKALTATTLFMINVLIGRHVYATKGNVFELESEINGQELEQQVLGYFAAESEAVKRKRRPLILK